MNLRDYQSRIVDEVRRRLDNYTGPFVVNAFQSSGKSIMIAEVAKDRKCLILCPNKELVEQNMSKLEMLGCRPTAYSASVGQKIISNITVGTIGSIAPHWQECAGFDLILIDECDAVPVDNNNSMFMKFLHHIAVFNPKVVGWTGTPFRIFKTYGKAKNGHLIQRTMIKPLTHKYWKDIYNAVEFDELAGKYCADIDYYKYDTDRSMLKVNTTGLDFTEASLDEYMDKNIITVVDAAQRASSAAKRVLITVANIETAEKVAEALIRRGVKADFLHSKMRKKERTERVNKFKSGETKVMVQVMILNVGFDLPELDVVIFARPCLSPRIWCQTVARGIRLDKSRPDKKCIIIDMADEYSLFGHIGDIKYRNGKIVSAKYVLSDIILNEVDVNRFMR